MSRYGVVAGLNKKATRLTCGAISLRSSSHLLVIVGSVRVKPVTLPPGRARLATKPLPTGSATTAKTMGIVAVCCSTAAVVGVLFARLRSGCSTTSSFATPHQLDFRRPTDVDSYIAALGPSKLLKRLSDNGDENLPFRVVLSVRHQHAEPPHPLGLCMRGE